LLLQLPHLLVMATSFSDGNITNVGSIALDSIAADDGSSFTISNNWTNAGNTIADLGIVTTVDINGGTVDGLTNIDNSPIGQTNAAAGAFTTLSSTGNSTLGDANTDTVTLNGIAAGTSNNVIVLDGSNVLKYDAIDARVWGTTLLDTNATGADNYVAVFSDADSVEGDSNLQWDGTALIIGNSKAASSTTFNSGFAGSGWKIDEGISVGGKASAEFDNLTIRGQMSVYEMLIHQVRATNGSIWVSNTGKIASSSYGAGAIGARTYTLFFESGSGAGHGFRNADAIRAQRWSPTGDLYQSDLFVLSTDIDTNGTGSLTATLSGSIGTGAWSDEPLAGMDYVRIGNISGSESGSRQGAIYLTADDSNAPYIDVVDGVTHHSTFNTSGNIKTRMGKLSGITSARFGALSGYGFFASGSAYLEGTINAKSGNIGTWGIGETAISSSGGIITLDSYMKRITITDGTNDQIYLGEVDGTSSPGSTYGMKIFDGSGGVADANRLVELGAGANMIAGWDLIPGAIKSDNVDGSVALSANSQSLMIFTGSIDNARPKVVVGKLPRVGGLTSDDRYGFGVFTGTVDANILDDQTYNVLITRDKAKLAGWDLVPGNIQSDNQDGSVRLSSVSQSLTVWTGSMDEAEPKLVLGKLPLHDGTDQTPYGFAVFSGTGTVSGSQDSASILITANKARLAGWDLVPGELKSGTVAKISGNSASIALGTGASTATGTPTDGLFFVSASTSPVFYVGSNFSYVNDVLTAGGWKIGNNIISSSTSADTDGLILDAANKVLTFHGADGKDSFSPGSATVNNVRLAVGQITTGSFGLIGYDGSGNTLLELTEAQAKIAGFYFSNNDIWGGNSAIGNSATTIVMGNLDGVSKVALGATADNLSLTAGTGFFADGGGDFRVGRDKGVGISFDSSAGLLVMSSSAFLLGDSGSAYVSGSGGNLEISSSNFFLKSDGTLNVGAGNFTVATNGDVAMTGNISATTGDIGGFNIGTNDLWGGNATIGNSATTIVMGNLNGTSKIALGASADSIRMDTGTGFYADGTGSFKVGKSDGGYIKFDGSNVHLSSSAFMMGNTGSAYISGSLGNLEISSSNFFVKSTGDVRMTGVISSSEGNIAGWTIDSDEIKSPNSTVILDSNSSNGQIKLGAATSVTAGDGIYMDGGGNFRAGKANGYGIKWDTSTLQVSSSEFYLGDATNYISGSGGAIDIAADTFDLKTTYMRVSSSAGGTIAMGTVIPKSISGSGVFLSGSGDFLAGNHAGNRIQYNKEASAIVMKSSTFSLDATTILIDSSVNDGKIALGASPNSSVAGTNAGIYMDGTGDFLVYGDSDNFFKFDVSDQLQIAAETFDLNAGGKLILNSTQPELQLLHSNARLTLGATANTSIAGTNKGVYMDGGGDFLLYGSATNYFKFDASGTSIDIKTDTFDLDAGTVIIDSAANSGKIALGTTPNTSVAGTNAGVYMDGTGDFLAYGDGDNYFKKDGTALTIKAETFNLKANTDDLVIDSAGHSISLADGNITLDGTDDGFFEIGTLADTSTVTGTLRGFRVDGLGNMLLKADDASTNYIKFDVDGGTSALEIKTANFSVVGGDVTMAGSVTATTGNIGGWSLYPEVLRAAVGDSTTNVHLSASADFAGLGVREAGRDVIRVGKISAFTEVSKSVSILQNGDFQGETVGNTFPTGSPGWEGSAYHKIDNGIVSYDGGMVVSMSIENAGTFNSNDIGTYALSISTGTYLGTEFVGTYTVANTGGLAWNIINATLTDTGKDYIHGHAVDYIITTGPAGAASLRTGAGGGASNPGASIHAYADVAGSGTAVAIDISGSLSPNRFSLVKGQTSTEGPGTGSLGARVTGSGGGSFVVDGLDVTPASGDNFVVLYPGEIKLGPYVRNLTWEKQGIQISQSVDVNTTAHGNRELKKGDKVLVKGKYMIPDTPSNNARLDSYAAFWTGKTGVDDWKPTSYFEVSGSAGVQNSFVETIKTVDDVTKRGFDWSTKWKTYTNILNIKEEPLDNIIELSLHLYTNGTTSKPDDSYWGGSTLSGGAVDLSGSVFSGSDAASGFSNWERVKSSANGPYMLVDDWSAILLGDQIAEFAPQGLNLQLGNEEFIKFTTGSGLEIESVIGSIGVDTIRPKTIEFDASHSFHNPIIGFSTEATQSSYASTLTIQGQGPLAFSASFDGSGNIVSGGAGGKSGDLLFKTLDGAQSTGSADGGNAGNISLKPGTGGIKGSCFVAGTKIETDMGTTFIEEIREGDNVKSFDFETNSVVTSKVKKTFIHYNKNYIIINGIIKTTIEHRFYSNNEWVHAGNLSIGDKILQIDGSKLIVETIESNDELETVYNFHVERTQNYFAEGCLVHNSKGNDDGTDGLIKLQSDVDITGDITFKKGADRTIEVATEIGVNTGRDLTIKSGDAASGADGEGGDLFLFGGLGVEIGSGADGGNVYMAGGTSTGGDGDVILAHTGGATRGRVGIGTTTPISIFEIEDGLTTVGAVLTLGTKEPSVVANDVLGRIDFYAPLDTGTDSDEIGASIVAIAQDTFSDSVNSTALHFQTGKSEVATTKMTIDEDGNVGIATTGPGAKLEVSGDIFLTEGADRTIKVTTATAGAGDDLTVKAGDIQAGTSDTPGGDLKLLGGDGIDTENTGGNVYIAGGADNSGTDGDVILAHTGGATRGRVGIGDTTPDYPLDVIGQVSNISIYAQYDIAAYSDIRVKTDIETITEPLNKVLKMRGVTFRRTDSNLDKRQMGVIAQEVEPYVPEVVSTVEDESSDKYGHKSVSYGNLTALLIEAIKEQQKQIEDLKEEVKEIKDAVSK